MLNWQDPEKNAMIKTGSAEPGKEHFYGTQTDEKRHRRHTEGTGLP